jgi:uncharacterized RDD family membrane protein YckC
VYRRLKILVPATQVLAYLALFALKLAVHMRVVRMDYDPLWGLLRSVNYPLWVVLLAVVYPVSWLVPPLPLGHWLYVGQFAVVALFLSGVGLFWYLVVAEIGMRRRGKSMLRFAGRFKELLAVCITFLFGAGAFIWAYAIAWTILPQSWRAVYIFLVPAYSCKLLSVLILTAWGIVLAGLAIHDLIAFLKAEAPRAG